MEECAPRVDNLEVLDALGKATELDLGRQLKEAGKLLGFHTSSFTYLDFVVLFVA